MTIEHCIQYIFVFLIIFNKKKLDKKVMLINDVKKLRNSYYRSEEQSNDDQSTIYDHHQRQELKINASQHHQMPLFCREQPPKPAPSTPTHMRTPLTSQTPHQQPPNHHYQLSSHSSHNNNHKKINFILLSAEKPRTQATLSKSQGKENRKGINVVSKDKMKNYKINASNYSMETPQRNKTERQREETVKRKEVTYFDHNYEANPLTEILKIKQPCFQNVLPLQSKNPSQYNSKIMSKIIAQRALYSKIKELNK